MRLTYTHNHGQTGGNNYYYEAFGGSTAANSALDLMKCVCGIAGTVENFVVRLSTAPGVGNSRTFAFEVNGSTLGSTATISGTSTSATVAGSLGSIAVGDVVRVHETTSGSPDVSTNTWIVFELNATVSDTYAHQGNVTLISAGSTVYCDIFNPAIVHATATNVTSAVASPCTMTATTLCTHSSFLSGRGVTATVQLSTDNGATYVDQDGTGGTVNTVHTFVGPAGVDAFQTQTFSLSLSRGHLVRLKLVGVSTVNSYVSVACKFTCGTSGEANYSSGINHSGTASSSVDNYNSHYRWSALAWGIGDGDIYRLYGGVTGFTLKNPYGWTLTAPGSGKSRTITLVYNGSASSPAFTLTGTAAPTVADGAGAQNVLSGGFFSIVHTPSGTPTVTSAPRWTFVFNNTVTAQASNDEYYTAFETVLNVPAAIGVLLNDTPSVGVTATQDAAVSSGTLNSFGTNGAFQYTPAGGFSGDATFTYHTNDGVSNSNIATVTIHVTGLTVPRAGTNPPYAEIPTDTPLLFMELKVGSAATAYAETPLNDNATWTNTVGTGTRKAPKILRVSSIRRELSNQGGFGTSQVTVEVSDEDREFRTLCATSTITNSYCALYLVDDSVRRAEGEPFRIFAGVVAEHRALPGFRYELTLEDALGAYFGNAFEQPQIPPHVLTVGEFSGMDPAAEGKAGPLAFGTLTDAAAASPQGVVPAIYMGNGQLNSISGHSLAVNTTVAAFAIVEHACRSIDNIFYNHPDSPTLRHAVDNSAFGTLVWAPHKPNWSAGVGWSHNYIDFGSPVRRYTPIFALLSHSLTLAAIDGRTIISANLAGQDSTGDATGTFYTQPERMLAQLLLNYVFTSYQSGSFTDVPFFTANSYTVYDTDTLNAAESIAATRLAGGYVGAWLGGADGSQFNGYDAMRDFALGGDFEVGANRHGQIIWARDSVSATPVCSFTAQSDILDGSFEMWTDRTDYANKLAYRYEERYLPPSAPLPTPSLGAPLPRDPFKDYSPWASSITTLVNTTAIANYNSRTVLYELDNRVVRQSSTALSVASYTFNRRIGPMQDGGWRFRFQTGLQGYGKGTARVELGSPILFDIPERLGTVASSPVIGYVTSHELDPQAKTVTLEGRVLR